MRKAVDAPLGRLLPASQAATRLGIGYHAVLRLIAGKQIAHVRHESGRLQGIYEADCDRYVEAHRVCEDAAPARARTSSFASREVDAAVDALLEPHERIFG